MLRGAVGTSDVGPWAAWLLVAIGEGPRAIRGYCRGFSQTAPLAEPFQAHNDELEQAHEATRRTNRPRLEARARLRALSCEIADGGRKQGPITKELFPDGLGAVVVPSGRAQVKPLEALIDRLTKSKRAELEGLRREERPKLEAALASLKEGVASDVIFPDLRDEVVASGDPDAPAAPPPPAPAPSTPPK